VTVCGIRDLLVWFVDLVILGGLFNTYIEVQNFASLFSVKTAT
jgi:hypothetical protein